MSTVENLGITEKHEEEIYHLYYFYLGYFLKFSYFF